MTADQISRSIRHQTDEYLDGYCLIGYVRETNTPVIVIDAKDPKSAAALNKWLLDIIAAGGVGCEAAA